MLYLFVFYSVGDKFRFTNFRNFAVNPRFTMFSIKINVRELILKEFFICLCLRSFDARGNTDKAHSVQNFSLDCPKITKGLMINLSWKAWKFEQQIEFQSFKIIQDFKKGHIWHFYSIYIYINYEFLSEKSCLLVRTSTMLCCYCKNPKNLDIRKVTVIILKWEKYCFTT